MHNREARQYTRVLIRLAKEGKETRSLWQLWLSQGCLVLARATKCNRRGPPTGAAQLGELICLLLIRSLILNPPQILVSNLRAVSEQILVKISSASDVSALFVF
jgi:hypothetical protein